MPKIKKNKSETVALSLPIGWLLAGLVVIAAASIWYHSSLSKPPAPPAQQATSQWQKISDRQALFASEIFMERDKTFVYIPFKFEGIPQELWLNFDSSTSAQPLDYLIAHPLLLGLTWPRVDKGAVRLYQKTPTYSSIDQFLKNPPDASKILVDRGVANTQGYSNLNATILSDQKSLEGFEYILTSFVPLIAKGDTFEYENSLDASQANVHNNAIQWMLFAPNNTKENPYSIGNIHIDYNRQ